MKPLYINYNCGVPKISFNRGDDATETTMSEMIEQYESKCSKNTFISIDDFIDSEVKKIDISGIDFDDASDLGDYIFGEADFLDFAFNALDPDHTDYPDLRDPQNEIIYEWERGSDDKGETINHGIL